MKFSKYIIVALGAFALYSCNSYAMYEGTHLARMKPAMIENEVNKLLRKKPMTAKDKANIDMLINALAAQAPSRANVLRERAAATEEKGKLVDEVEYFEYIKKSIGVTKEESDAMKKEFYSYKEFQQKIKTVTTILKDTNTYLDKQKIMEIVTKFGGVVDGGTSQKIKNIQDYLIQQGSALRTNLAPFTVAQFKQFIADPQSASERAYFKDALADLFASLDRAVNAAHKISIKNPAAARRNEAIINDFILGKNGLIELMEGLIDLGSMSGVLTQRAIEDETNRVTTYKREIGNALLFEEMLPSLI